MAEETSPESTPETKEEPVVEAPVVSDPPKPPAPLPTAITEDSAPKWMQEFVDRVEAGRTEDREYIKALEAKLDEFYAWAKENPDAPTIEQPPVIVPGSDTPNPTGEEGSGGAPDAADTSPPTGGHTSAQPKAGWRKWW